jgi:transposase
MQEGHRVIVASGIALAQYAVEDRMAEAYWMVNLVEQGWADQNDVALAFGVSARTVRRHQGRYEKWGLSALGRGDGYPEGRARLRVSRRHLVKRLKTEGHSNCDIARRMGVNEKAVRKMLRQMGWSSSPEKQQILPLEEAGSSDPNLSAFSKPASAPPAAGAMGADPDLFAFPAREGEPVPFTFDSDPADRRMDRLLAYLGFLDDAAPIFRPGTDVHGAGVLLAIPAIEQSGVLDCADKIYGSIGPAFYGLRTTIVGLLLFALLRIKRPEGLKEHAPDDLGRILGLDRAPEVKTLRRKLSRLASYGRAARFGRELAERRVRERGAAMGFLYVDGHVRVYHGRHTLPKAHVARMRLAMPATSDYWINDKHGDPLFVVTAEANAGMVKMLPVVLAEVRDLVGDRRVTVVFDRGGYSPQLFADVIARGFDLLTYRKGRFPRVPRKRFAECKAMLDGKKVSYLLADQEVRLRLPKGARLPMRQVTRLSDAHQTPVLTSRRDLPAVQVAFRMFERWRQENFFKYLREEYALDALVEYGVEPDDENRTVPNPARRKIEARLRTARAEAVGLQAEFGQAAQANPENRRPTMRGFKIAHGKIGRKLRVALKRVADLQARRARMPLRVPVGEAIRSPVVKLAPERKLLTNQIKMVAYQAESDLVRRMASYYKRTEDEGRTLIQNALAARADLEVTGKELRVTLAPMSSAHRTRAIAALCEELNRMPVVFPGSHLRLRYAIRESR